MHIKRSIDILGSAAALVVLSPLLAVIALAIKLTSSGPVFYRWKVIGKNGKPFLGYKFRTMVVNADALKDSLLEFNERRGPTFKMKNDPRITPVGRVVRRYSLDEFPQFWSIFKGDMSLVGPRPVAPHEWEQFEEWQRRKLSVTPGMICLWHAVGKPEGFGEWIKLDLKYIDNWSLWLDLKLLVSSMLYVLSGRNY